MTLGIGLIAPAGAQAVPKLLEQGGTDAALKQRKNTGTVGIAGGILSGTYMTFAAELALAGRCRSNHDVSPRGPASHGAAPFTCCVAGLQFVTHLRKLGERLHLAFALTAVQIAELPFLEGISPG
jgi:hypothetical protein